MKKNVLLSFFLLVPHAAGQEVSFFKEDVNFWLFPDRFKVDGYYWFANGSNENITKLMFYPFGNNNGERVDSVVVSDMERGIGGKIVNRTEKGISFLLEINARDTVAYHVRYDQGIGSDSVKYILMTTRLWEKPLESAEYKLMAGEHVQLTKSSYEPDRIYSIAGKKIVYWNRKDFLPAADLVFHFKTDSSR